MRGGFNKFYERYYAHLVGRKITKVGISEDGFPWFMLDDGSKCEVSQDEEGNGPGWLFGLPVPE